MYNNGFGAYPQDDMDMGVSSYFGESDTNFFGDTSNDSFFGEGCGVTGFGNAEFFNESVGFSTDGSEVISEACDYGYGYSDMICEANTTDNVSSSSNKDKKTIRLGFDTPLDRQIAKRKKDQAAEERADMASVHSDPHKALKRLKQGNYSSHGSALHDFVDSGRTVDRDDRSESAIRKSNELRKLQKEKLGIAERHGEQMKKVGNGNMKSITD